MEVQRFTKYPLLLENMAKYTGNSCSASQSKATAKIQRMQHPGSKSYLRTEQLWKWVSCVLESPFCCFVAFFTQKTKRKEKRWKEPKSVARKSWTTSTRQSKKLKTNRLSLQSGAVFSFQQNNISMSCVFSAPKETARVSETAGHLITQAGRPPHDPGAEGKKHLLHHTQEEPNYHLSPSSCSHVAEGSQCAGLVTKDVAWIYCYCLVLCVCVKIYAYRILTA